VSTDRDRKPDVDQVTQAQVFAALEAISAGQWDRWLHRIRGAIVVRTQTDDYQNSIIAGGTDERH